jgi:YggT family protein
VLALIADLLLLFLVCLFVRIALSWFPLAPGGVMASIYRVLYRITEPVLGPVRAVIPPLPMGGMSLDLSPIIVIIVIYILLNFLK